MNNDIINIILKKNMKRNFTFPIKISQLTNHPDSYKLLNSKKSILFVDFDMLTEMLDCKPVLASILILVLFF